VKKGAYVARDCAGEPEVVVVATGSEVHVAIKAAEELSGMKVRVVSMVCRELFVRQPADFRKALIPPGARKMAFEAGVSFGWSSPLDDGVTVVGIDRFGESGPYQELAERFGITAAALTRVLRG
jgi:transketolase